jgi:preprotein translocase subunit SecE
MLKFFYDSLDTLKQVKKPTKKEVVNITIAIFIIVILA